MDINLLHEHNREAYQKVMQHFNEGHQKACVVHATGTGKSMIITAVSDHFERVLILTTNMFTIEQVGDTFKKHSPERTAEPTFMIYQALLQQMRDDVDYSHAFDLIVFDEFHHGGAEEWGKAVNWIIEQNPSAKVLGTSATAIRHSDGGRDMGDELFDGNVVSTLSLGEAWARKVLMAPYYIMAVEDSEEFYNDFIRKIEESNLLEDKKAHYREMAKNVKDNYEMEKNAPEIIRKWLPADTRRIIVFSKDIQEAESNLAKVKKWMTKAGFTIAGIYMVHSNRPFEEKQRQMALFRDDDFTGVKVMVAVDMLNEGVHVPGIDSVFFLRKTQSPTIHLQQMGRCMYRYKEDARRPVVFDFRNNVENTRRAEHTGSFFSDAAKDYDAWKDLHEEDLDTQVVREQNKPDRVRENFPDGINYTMDYSIMVDRFNEEVKWQDEWGLLEYYVGVAEEYYKHHGSRIKFNVTHSKEYDCIMYFLRNENKRAERSDLVERLFCCGFDVKAIEINWTSNYSKAKNFFDKKGRFPNYKDDAKLAAWAYNWYEKNYLLNPDANNEKATLLHDIGFEYHDKYYYLERSIQLYIDYYNINKTKRGFQKVENGNPWQIIENFFRLKTHKERSDLRNLIEKYGWHKELWEFDIENNLCVLRAFVKNNGSKKGFSTKYPNQNASLSAFLRDENKIIKRSDLKEEILSYGFTKKDNPWELLEKAVFINEFYFNNYGRKIPYKGEYKNPSARINDFLRNEDRMRQRPDLVKRLINTGCKIIDSDKSEWEYTIEECIVDLQSYVNNNNNNKGYSKYSPQKYQIIRKFLNNEEYKKKRPELINVLFELGVSVSPNLLLERIRIAENYFKENGKRIPSEGEYRNIYSTILNFLKNKNRCDKNPEYVDILHRSGF